MRLILLLFRLVGCRSDGRAYDGTTRHTYQLTDVTAAPSTGDSADGRTDDRAKIATSGCTRTGIGSTTAQKQHRTD